MRTSQKRVNTKNGGVTCYSVYKCRHARASDSVAGTVCHKKQYRGDWAERLVIGAVQKMAQQPELAVAALKAYKQAQVSEQLQPDMKQLQEQLKQLQREAEATAQAQVQGVMAGIDTTIYESMLHKIAKKRAPILEALDRAGQSPQKNAGKTRKLDEAALISQAAASVDAVLNAPDNCLTPAEKQGLLSRIVEAISPEGSDGLRIQFKPTFTSCQSVQYFTT